MIAADKPPLEEAYLEHFGIKGMHWGQRKPEDPAHPRQHGMSPRNQKLVTAAFAVGVVALGAVMVSRGRTPVWNAGASKQAMGGFRMSSKILGKTGSVIVRGSAKTGKVVGKGAFKSGKFVGRTAGKAAAKAGYAGAKATGRAFLDNGAKTVSNIRKGAVATAKLTSHASFRLTGVGTPMAERTLARHGSVDLVGMLLNTRGDTLRRGNR